MKKCNYYYIVLEIKLNRKCGKFLLQMDETWNNVYFSCLKIWWKTNSTIIYKIKIFSVIQRYCCKSGFWRFTATSHQNIITFADQKFQTCSLYVLILKFLLTIFTDENCSKTYSKILIKIIMYNLIRSNMQFLPAFENQINHNHN